MMKDNKENDNNKIFWLAGGVIVGGVIGYLFASGKLDKPFDKAKGKLADLLDDIARGIDNSNNKS